MRDFHSNPGKIESVRSSCSFPPSCIFSKITPVLIANTMHGNPDYYPYYFDLPYMVIFFNK